MRKEFITGLVILLPVAVTIAVVVFLVNLLTKPFMGIAYRLFSDSDIANKGFLFLSPEQVLRYGSQIVILILLFLFTLLLGCIARSLLMKSLLRLGDRIIARIPLVSSVYKTTQDIIKTVFVSDKNSFKQVVLVPFPKEGSYVLGLIARESPASCSRILSTDLISVLIPTTPNPTTGFLLMFPRSALIPIDMRPEDAIKYIVSCGLVVPEDKTIAVSTTLSS